MTLQLFNSSSDIEIFQEQLAPGLFILKNFIKDDIALLAELNKILLQAPLRHMATPGGYRMSVAMSNCGSLGWITDKRGYRYSAVDPLTNKPWPKMPDTFFALATNAAAQVGFTGFKPDACLINCYAPGAKMSLHQDKDEKDFSAPIVSISLGIPATFLWGGLNRKDKVQRMQLTHGDIIVWGGIARLYYHGIEPIDENTHPLLNRHRFNLTFRKAA